MILFIFIINFNRINGLMKSGIIVIREINIVKKEKKKHF